MNKKMEVKPLTLQHLDIIAHMAAENYSLEQRSVGALMDKELSFFEGKLNALVKDGTGVIAYENGEPVGFLAFKVAHAAGNGGIRKGISPIYGYGIRHRARGKTIGLMFQKAAAHLCENYVQDLSVSVYAHDLEALREYIMLAFAMDDTDVVRTTEQDIHVNFNQNYSFREVTKAELRRYRSDVVEMYRLLINHLRNSPVFYPCMEFLPVENRLDDFMSEGIRVFAAFDGDRLVGMVDAEKSDRVLSAGDAAGLSMGDVFIKEAYRGQDLAASLLKYANECLKADGVKRLYVHHGTINPNARNFWDKLFTNYVYTLNRSMDPNMLGIIQQI